MMLGHGNEISGTASNRVWTSLVLMVVTLGPGMVARAQDPIEIRVSLTGRNSAISVDEQGRCAVSWEAVPYSGANAEDAENIYVQFFGPDGLAIADFQSISDPMAGQTVGAKHRLPSVAVSRSGTTSVGWAGKLDSELLSVLEWSIGIDPTACGGDALCDETMANDFSVISVPPGQSCETVAFQSRCMGDEAYEHGSEGYPLNIELWHALGPADYPPLSQNAAQSSSPLVSNEGIHSLGPSPYRERPTHNGILDLITGQPLLQEIDFSLPFGSAVFRHVRTFTENPDKMPVYDWLSDSGDYYWTGDFWDWNGMSWMMSENPIFLIDAAYKELVSPDQKRCYFIPDAHHAIPFMWFPGSDKYVAPPWFGAQMDHNGVMDTVTGEWTTLPTEFYVWLYRRSVKYTIMPFYEDLWEVDGVSVHQPDGGAGAGDGYPYYGVVSQIQDRHGNRVEYDYCRSRQWDCDDSQTTDCKECCQNCNEKGQLKSIKLRTGGGDVAWTLVYTHREFGDVSAEPYDTKHPLFNQHALHSIHVYDKDIDVSYLDCMTISQDKFCAAGTIDAIDNIDAVQLFGLDADWVFEAKYLYRDDRGDVNCEGLGDASIHDHVAPSDALSVSWGHLVKTTITRRNEDENGSAKMDRRFTLYRHGASGPCEQQGSGVSLRKVIYNDSIGGILEALGNPAEGVNKLLTIADAQNGHASGSDERILYDHVDIDMPRILLEGSADASGEFETTMIDDFTSADSGRTVRAVIGKQFFIDRRANASQSGAFAIYKFVQYPSDLYIEPGTFLSNICHRGLTFHYPYFYRFPPNGSGPQLTPRRDEVFFITVIDEVTDLKDYFDQAWNFVDANSPITELLSRRVVEMNPAGFVLSDRLWTLDDSGQFTTNGNPALGIKREYDCAGRVVQERSIGWSVAEANGDGADEGLIHVFEYEDDYIFCNWDPENDKCGCQLDITTTEPGELVAEAIQKGTDGTRYYIRKFERGIPERPELVTKVTLFPEPVTDHTQSPPPPSAVVTETVFVFDDSEEPNIENQPIIQKTLIHPPAPRTKGGPDYYVVGKSYYDNNGNLEWVAVGTMLNPEGDPDPDTDELFIVYSHHDRWGRPRELVVDADPSAPNAPTDLTDGTLPALPEGLARAGEAQALNLVTEYEYQHYYGLHIVHYPNDREDWISYAFPIALDDYGIFQWTFKDVTEEDGVFKTPWPVRVRYMLYDKVITDQTIRLIDTDDRPDGYGAEEDPSNRVVISTATPGYDADGRPVAVSRDDGAGNTLSAAVAYDGFGNLVRGLNPDGTITRNTYDDLGRLERVYRGTCDEHDYWGTAGETPSCTDNMVLSEKHYYGEGITDAHEKIRVRYYDSLSDNQYFITGGDPPPLDNNEDDIGWTTEFGYDWRMRPVWEHRTDEAGAALGHTLTWYDNLDRAVLVAEYGPAYPAGVDPRSMGPGEAPPTAATVLGASPAPTALTENIYNLRGQIEESRRYNTDSASVEYTATFTYYDHNDKPVEVRAPNAPIQQYVYDGKGRQVIARTLAGTTEITHSDTVYDPDDRAVETVHWERRHDATGDGLDTSNSVRTFTQTWYDVAGRVIASANFGTNNDTFSNNVIPETYDITNPPPAPVTFDTEGQVDRIDTTIFGPEVLITGYAYDNAGRQAAVFHPDGTVTRTEYDGLGRTLMTIENADETLNTELIRRTAYRYDGQGRLSMMAAVLPNAGVSSHLDISTLGLWDSPAGNLQITEFIYEADVVDAGGAAISRNNGSIGEVRFPDPVTGAPNPADAIKLTYRTDGSVATRTDARGVVHTHAYDELGRRTETLIDDSAFYIPPAEGEADYRPPNRIKRIAYIYESDGLLQKVTAYTTPDGGGAETIVTENVYAYDTARNLASERQSHGAVAGAGTPAVDYAWDYSNAVSGGNHNRLTTITYPTPPEGGARRTETFSYLGAIDGALSRVSQIDDDHGIGPSTAAIYNYAGSFRRIARSLGSVPPDQPLIIADFSNGGGAYTGLDRFGRIIDLHYTGGGQTIHHYEYGYDLAGNRLFARGTQAPTDGGSTPHNNDRSYLYGYDALNRLTSADLGVLNGTNDAIATGVVGPLPSSTLWNLDNLGNWAGNSSDIDGLVKTIDGILETVDHEIDNTNAVTQTLLDGVADGKLTYDACGSIVAITGGSAGDYLYFYDGLNRLVQVSEPGTAALNSQGQVTGGSPGALIARYSYDGQGRLITIERPDPTAQGPSGTVTAHFYYDGVRRIQEVIDDGSATPAPEVQREYVYGPDYVDEFIFQAPGANGQGDAARVPFFILQDANYNVMAVTDATGAVLEQYTYAPYGEILAVDHPQGSPGDLPFVNRTGHQGLFNDRLGSALSTSAGSITLTTPALTPDAVGLYYNRNRYYDPRLGRFTQRDPNETAMPILVALVSNGEAMALVFSEFNPKSLFRDGMNLYQYVGSNSINQRDPLGLDEFDDLIGDLTGQRVATLGFIAEASGFALLGTNTAVNIAGSLLGLDLFRAGSNILSGEGTFSDWLEVGVTAAATATGAILAYKAIKWFRKFKAARRFRKAIEEHHLLPLEFADDFAKAGIRKLDDFVIDLDRARHRLKPNGIHTNAGGNWNRRWKQFFKEFKDRNQRADQDDVMRFLAQLRGEFGI